MNKTLSKTLVLVLLIGVMAGCASWRDNHSQNTPTDRGASTPSRSDDAALTAKVKAKLLSDDALNAMKIDVDTQSGVVFLSGVVDTADQKQKAIGIAKNTEGVRRVEDNLKVGKFEGSSSRKPGKALPVHFLEDVG
ncbi:MAG: BON domain-containing protein [Nitrospirae bacterium]|nr:BON domain-containing protein [Candidatus Manganitrophaceae bacterium]